MVPIDRAARKARKVSSEEPTLSEQEVKDAVALQEMMEGKAGSIEMVKKSISTQTTFFAVRNNSTQSKAAETDEQAINDIIESGKLRILNIYNYPNPFTNKTQFSFEITKDADIEIDIFTLSGS